MYFDLVPEIPRGTLDNEKSPMGVVTADVFANETKPPLTKIQSIH